MKKLLFAALVSSFFLASCGKDDDPAPNPSGSDKYMSFTAGNTWNYAYTDNVDASNNSTYSVTSTNSDSTAAGKSYHIFANSDGSHEYYNITGSDYYTMQVFSLTGTDTTLENLYLKDNAAVNTSWTQNYTIDASGVPVDVAVTNKIQEKDITKTIGAVTYNNVIHVVTTISIPTLATLPGSSISTDINYYFAPKTGMIQNDAKIDLVVPLLSVDDHTNTLTQLTSTNF